MIIFIKLINAIENCLAQSRVNFLYQMIFSLTDNVSVNRLLIVIKGLEIIWKIVFLS